MVAINIPLYTIRHSMIGGTEFGIYSWIKGLAETEARVSVTYGRDRDLSPDFLSWLRGHPGIDVSQYLGLTGPKSLRFVQEFLFENRRTPHDWAIYPNYFCPPRVRRSERRRGVILHDIQYRIFPHYHSSKRRAWLDYHLPKMFDQADLVLLISESERELIRGQFGAGVAERCEVVFNAVDWRRLEPLLPSERPASLQDRLDRPYILSVCHQFPHKNVLTLLKAFVAVAHQDRDVQLYLIGKASEANKAFIRQAVPAELADRVQVLGFVDDRTLGSYYAHARLFVLPSLYEGCGVPAVEAMGFGVPTLVSRAYALPESTLGRASYVDDPSAVDEWAGAMERLLNGPERLPFETVDAIRATYAPKAIGQAMLGHLAART